jgi:diphthine-ammonia ligase
VEPVSLSVGDIAPVAYLRINAADLGKANDDRVFLPPKIPPLLDGKWEEVEASVDGINIDGAPTQTIPTSPAYATQALSPVIIATKPGRRGVWYSISNAFVPQTENTSIEIECRGCWEKVRSECSCAANPAVTDIFSEKLLEFHLDLMSVSHVNVYLSSMAHFPAINAVMYSIFGSSPPTRACVSVDLPAPYRVCLDIIAFSDADRRARLSLHVQSLSYWAPANIGPYSQSITVRPPLSVSYGAIEPFLRI